MTQHFHVLVLFAGAFCLGIAVLCLCIFINKFSVYSACLIWEKPSQWYPFCNCVFIIFQATFLVFVFVVWMLFIWFGELAFEISGYLLGNVQLATCHLCLRLDCLTLFLCFFLHSRFLLLILWAGEMACIQSIWLQSGIKCGVGSHRTWCHFFGYFNNFRQKYRILTYRDKRESYLIVLQQNNV